ncbi:MAG: helix-turn-helix transcriptional regulator, partial [Thermoplasmata archaeon]|nr:helix-turn-helix transcriptional regulator [Thermoplasmata archaeon]
MDRGQSPTARSLPALLYQHDPIRQSVQRLGRKWTLLLVRDLAFLNLDRFGEFRRNNPGLSARVLSRRLREMEREGLVLRRTAGREVRYRLTRRGEEAALILLAFLNYGLKHHVGPQPTAWTTVSDAGATPCGRPLPRSANDRR